MTERQCLNVKRVREKCSMMTKWGGKTVVPTELSKPTGFCSGANALRNGNFPGTQYLLWIAQRTRRRKMMFDISLQVTVWMIEKHVCFKCNFYMTRSVLGMVGWSVDRSVGWLVGRSVCHSFLKGKRSYTSMPLSELLFHFNPFLNSGLYSEKKVI